MTFTTKLTVIKFNQDSFLKQAPSTFVKPSDLGTGNAIKVMAGTQLTVTEIENVDPSNSHRKVKVEPAIAGKSTWYIFAKHIAVGGDAASSIKVKKLGFTQASYLKQNPNKSVTQADIASGNAVSMAQDAIIGVSEFGAIDPANKHRKIKVSSPVNGIVTWYVFAEHVAIAP